MFHYNQTIMSVKKKFFKKNGKCKVTLSLSKEQANKVDSVAVLGDFNDWNPEADVMNRLKSGDFKTTLELEKGKSYQFRYLKDGEIWDNEPEADDSVANFHGSRNSIIYT